MKKILLLALAGIVFQSCKILDFTPEDPIKGAGAVTMKFVQINDVYEIDPISGGKYGGLARVAYIRDSIKKENPNTFLFLAGDFLNPSLLGTLKVDGEQLNGKQMVDVLNAMDVDLVTFGNHEFDLSEKDLQKRMNESNFTWTSANVRHVTENGLQPFSTKWEYSSVPTSDYSTFSASDPDGNKIRFGVFGVTLPSNPKSYVHYGDIYDNAIRAYNLAMEKSDFTVGLTHVSLEQDMEIARRITYLPLIMGGHEHHNILEKVGRTIIAKADANAKSLWVHTLIYNIRTKELSINSDLVLVTDKTPSSAKVERVVNKWTELLDKNLEEIIENPNGIIYYAKSPLDGTDTSSRGKQTNLGQIIAASMTAACGSGAQGALVNGGSVRIDDHLVGDISGKDIFRVLPFGGEVVRVTIKGNLLKKVLDFGENARGTGAYLQRHNFSKDTNGNWLLNGFAIQDNRNYTIAMSDFLLKGLDIPFLTAGNPGVVNVYYPKKEETASDIRKAVIHYLKGQK